jgi:hypothetical protein
MAGWRHAVELAMNERCVERALAYGPLTALDDRPRPGKEPTITPEAKAWLVSLACDNDGLVHGDGIPIKRSAIQTSAVPINHPRTCTCPLARTLVRRA